MTRRKFYAKKVKVDGHTFDSKGEAERYKVLKLLEMAKEISELGLHIKFPLTVNGVSVGSYTCDFAYLDRDQNRIIEDYKGHTTTKHVSKKTGKISYRKRSDAAYQLFDLKFKIAAALYPDKEFKVVSDINAEV